MRINGGTLDEEELNDMRLAEELKLRQLRREKQRRSFEQDPGKE